MSETATTYQTTQQRMLARLPQRCPRCGSDEIAPLFEGDLWDCSAAGCGHVWSDGRDG